MFGLDPIIVYSVAFMGAIGLIFGLGLGLAAKKFAVKIDEKEENILNLLPGVNCGACGFPGCSGYAAAMAKGEAEPGKCTVNTSDKNKAIAQLLGKEAEDTEIKKALILCGGGKNCRDKMEYRGIRDCTQAANFFGGSKECTWGCLGYGTCVSACPFGAISQKDVGDVPHIDWNKCTMCGICVSACPKHIIHMVPCKFRYHILCQSQDKGAAVRKICPPGCIGCGICVKSCPVEDITLEKNLAHMKYDKCTHCGICFEKCPTKTIKNIFISALKKTATSEKK